MAMASLGIFRFRDAWGLLPLLGAGDRRHRFLHPGQENAASI